MKKWRTELTSCGEVLGEVNIRRGIFQGDSLSPLLFVVALIPLSLVLRSVKPAYEFTNKEKINHLLFMDDLKLFAKSEKGLESLVQTVKVFSKDIGYGIWIRQVCYVSHEKREEDQIRRNRSVGSREDSVTR